MRGIVQGESISPGIGIGRAYFWHREQIQTSRRLIDHNEIEKEIGRFDRAVGEFTYQPDDNTPGSSIMEGHSYIARDILLREAVTDKIKQLQNAENALEQSISEFETVFQNMDDVYMRERAADVRDVGYQLLYILKGTGSRSLEELKEPVIIIADEILPSDTIKMDLRYVKGFITGTGGYFSHAGIIARNKGIPVLTGVGDITDRVKQRDLIVLDASVQQGKIIIEPECEIIEEYKKQIEIAEKHKTVLMDLINSPSVTRDGYEIKLSANAGDLEDVRRAAEYGAQGIGLFRTELLFMERDSFPTEEEQFVWYQKVLGLCTGEITFRTLDIGGDKHLSYYNRVYGIDNSSKELRGIQASLAYPEIFRIQLRALLRASAYGIIRIMLPMIKYLAEYLEAAEILQECKEELRREGMAYSEEIALGIMAETFEAVENIENLAEKVDFISIGTNDLTRSLLGNNPVDGSYHPTVIRSIHKIVQSGKRYNIRVGLCGELAGDPRASSLLIGIGMKELSMSPSRLSQVKQKVREIQCEQALKDPGNSLKIKDIEELIRGF